MGSQTGSGTLPGNERGGGGGVQQKGFSYFSQCWRTCSAHVQGLPPCLTQTSFETAEGFGCLLSIKQSPQRPNNKWDDFRSICDKSKQTNKQTRVHMADSYLNKQTFTAFQRVIVETQVEIMRAINSFTSAWLELNQKNKLSSVSVNTSHIPTRSVNRSSSSFQPGYGRLLYHLITPSFCLSLLYRSWANRSKLHSYYLELKLNETSKTFQPVTFWDIYSQLF